MDLAALSLADLSGTILGFVLTIFVFSYVFGDNFIFRFTMHVFIGVAAGYVAVVALYNVVWPQLVLPLINGPQPERIYVAVPFVLGLMLLLKAFPRLSRLGQPAMAYLVGVGVAAAIGGAVMGTIFPQVEASIDLFDLDAARETGAELVSVLFNGSVVLVGTLTTLVYFHFGARSGPDRSPIRFKWIEIPAQVGQIFIAIAFGVLFAGVYVAALTALIERLYFIGDLIIPAIPTG